MNGRSATKIEGEMAVKLCKYMDIMDYIKWHLAGEITGAYFGEPDNPCGCDENGHCDYHHLMATAQVAINKALGGDGKSLLPPRN